MSPEPVSKPIAWLPPLGGSAVAANLPAKAGSHEPVLKRLLVCLAGAAYVAMLLSAAAGAQTKPAADPVPQLEQALAKNPGDPKVNLALGLAYLDRSDFAQAIAALRKAVALEPESIAAHFALGMALRETGDLETALQHLGRVVKAEPGNASMHYEFGQTLRHSGKLGEAIAEFERALAI